MLYIILLVDIIYSAIISKSMWIFVECIRTGIASVIP